MRDAVSAPLAFQLRIDIAAVARQAGIPSASRCPLGRLGAAGRLGVRARSSGSYFTGAALIDLPHSRRCIHGCAMHVHRRRGRQCASTVISPRSSAAAASTPSAGQARLALLLSRTASTRTAADRASTSWPAEMVAAPPGEPRGRRSSRRWGGPGEDRFPWPAVSRRWTRAPGRQWRRAPHTSKSPPEAGSHRHCAWSMRRVRARINPHN